MIDPEKVERDLENVSFKFNDKDEEEEEIDNEPSFELEDDPDRGDSSLGPNRG